MKARPIVITGATRGLGRALAIAYDREGYTVHGCGHHDATVADLKEQLSPESTVSKVDVGDSPTVNDWAERVSRSGAPCLVCHCAGTLPVRLPFVEVPAEELEKSVRTNLIGAANVARAFLPALSNAGTGTLAVMASNPEGYPLANLSVYALCKTAVERLWQAISAEVEDTELAVVAVYPGLVQTDMLTASLGEQAKDYPLPSDWARIAAPFLLGLDPEANGQHLTIPTE